MLSRRTTPTVIPTMKYDDAPAAIEWLCRAFGFARHLVVPDESGGIAHAQLVFGNGMIMLGSSSDDAFGKLQKPPKNDGAIVTQSACVIVDDPDAHYAQAVAAGTEIVVDLVEQHYGGKSYTCRDPEGHVWTFGSYDPWAEA